MDGTLDICNTPVPPFEGDILDLQRYGEMLFEQAGQFVVVLKCGKLGIISETLQAPFAHLSHETIEYFFPSVLQPYSELEVPCDTEPLSPFYVACGECNHSFVFLAFPCHSAARNTEFCAWRSA